MSAGARVAAVRSRLRQAVGEDAGSHDGHDSPDLAGQVRRLTARVDDLQETVEALSAELLDARSQGRRIGEISDLVTELLAHEASRHDPGFTRILERYLDDPLPGG